MGDRITTIKDCPKCGGKGTFECYEALSSNLKYDECSNCDYNVSYDFEEQADGVVNITALPSEHLTPKGASKHNQDTPISNTEESLAEGYDFQDFREAYRKYHPQTEAPTAFIVELIAMQAAVLADQPELAPKPHPSNTEQSLRTALTLLTNFAARQTRLHMEGKPLEGNITDEENKFLELVATHTAEAVRDAEQKTEHYWIKYYGDQRIFLDGSDGDMPAINELNRHQQLHKDRLAQLKNHQGGK